MHPLTILFTYYQDDQVTRLHLRLLQYHNPGVPIIPVVDGAPTLLPDTIDVQHCPWRWGGNRDPWHNVDTLAYRCLPLLPTRQRAQRYAVVESDTLVTMSLADYYQAVWQADVAASIIASPHSHPHWVWWQQPLPAQLHPYRTGIMPSGVVLYSARALQLLAHSQLACFAELRVGTLCRAAGMELAQVPGGIDTVDCGDQTLRLSSQPGVYHPVKQYGGRDGLCRQAHQLGCRLLAHGSPGMTLITAIQQQLYERVWQRMPGWSLRWLPDAAILLHYQGHKVSEISFRADHLILYLWHVPPTRLEYADPDWLEQAVQQLQRCGRRLNSC